MINDNYNICNIYKYIKRIKGLKTGASPTDAWIITFKDNIKYKNDKIDKAFLKIFADKSIFNYIDKENNLYDDLDNAIDGLMYESNVYKLVITPLVDLKICPNFIRCIGVGKLCSYDDLFKMLDNHYYTKNKKLRSKIIKKRLKRSINNNILNYHADNYGFSEESNNKNYISSKFQNFDITKIKFNIILTETFDNIISFHDLLVSDYVQEINIFNILFQIFCACYSLILSKGVHNDLHTGNIMIRPLNKPITLVYFINKKKYVIKVNYLVHIYDFDRSYVKKIGNNKSLYMYGNYSQNNEVIDNKDIMKLLCSVYKYTKNKIYLKCLTNSNLHIERLIKLYGLDRGCNFQVDKKKAVDSSFFKNYNNPYTILDNFYENLPEITINKFSDIHDIYVCDKDVFDNNGEINKSKLNKIRKEMISKLNHDFGKRKSIKRKSSRKSRKRKSIK